jgi:hypothetical protein
MKTARIDAGPFFVQQTAFSRHADSDDGRNRTAAWRSSSSQPSATQPSRWNNQEVMERRQAIHNLP